MKNWYLTREGGNCIHRGVTLKGGKKVLLSETEAYVHNKNQEFLVETEVPKDISECACPDDFTEVSLNPKVQSAEDEARRERRKSKKEATE